MDHRALLSGPIVMQVPQAIFTSAETGRMKGYQLVSRSPEIDPRMAQELCRWSPSHASLARESADSWSFNAFPAGPDATAVARTLHGGPEYSSRGGMQVVTLMLVLTREQLAGYDDDALAAARTALAVGRLHLPAEFPAQIPAVDLPARALLPSGTGSDDFSEQRSPNELPPVLREARQLLLAGRRVAVIGQADPIASLQRLSASLPPEQRCCLSFTTGLKPSARRQFQLHFLPTADAALERALASQGIECVGFSSS